MHLHRYISFAVMHICLQSQNAKCLCVQCASTNFLFNFVPFQLGEILLQMQDLLLLSESFLILETSFSLLNGKTD